MTVRVIERDVPTRAEWQSMWAECEYATFFQSPTWAEIWQEATAGAVRAAPRRLIFSDGRRAILPLCHERKLGGLLDRLVASPAGTFGGWLSAEPLGLEHARALLGELLGGEQSSLVWRMNPYDDLALRAASEAGVACKPDVTHTLALDPGPDRLLSGFRNGYKKDVKKALEHGRISIEPAQTLSEWRAYHRVYQETLVRWGHERTEGYPWRLFEVMSELGPPHVTLWLARYDGAIVSGELCMYAQKHAVSWHAATLAEHLRTNVAKVQIFHVIRDAHARGYRWFDFNPSAGLEGVRAFKESFGATPLPAPLVYVDSRAKAWVRRVASQLGVPYAKLALEPVAQVLERTRPPASGALQPAAGARPRKGRAPGLSEPVPPSRDSSRPSTRPPDLASPG